MEGTIEHADEALDNFPPVNEWFIASLLEKKKGQYFFWLAEQTEHLEDKPRHNFMVWMNLFFQSKMSEIRYGENFSAIQNFH